MRNRQTHTSLPLVIFALMCLCPPLSASDKGREQHWEQLIRDSAVGESLGLATPEGDRFLALYTPSVGEPQGAIILAHGMGVHPDWPDVIQPLRVNLPRSGWATLSLQMPVADRHAPYSEYQQLFGEVPGRINAAIAFLKEKGIYNIVLGGHSMGAAMALSYLAENPDKSVRAFLAIGLSAAPADPNPGWIETLQVPTLDLFGERDTRWVMSTSASRLAAALRGGNPDYRQLLVPGADHFFRGLDDALVTRVRSWLARVAPGSEVPKDRTRVVNR
ncbi:MAG: alpha/beta fold hydrolase [Chromatiales bacterium]|nr:alpha/beta fold hydrolase [Chromatiales bacterium]